LLGDARARTASSAQIAKSALEVFEAREMGRYEAEGRVLASCVERVSAGFCGRGGRG
jgi:hypothetical protein